MQINGFEVDKFNQYGYSENAKVGICPLCSADRKKSTEKCASLFWDTGIGHCNHCGQRFQLHTFAKKSEQVKIYKRPAPINITDLPDKTVNWFKSQRGISQATLKLMQITAGVEWMPSKDPEKVAPGERMTIQFNYFVNSELVNVKYRDAYKNFKMVSDAEKVFYNLDNIKLLKSCIIVEGEIDALSFIEAEIYSVVSTPNGSPLPPTLPNGEIDITRSNVNLDYLDNYIEYFDNKEIVYLALDNDAPGRNVQNEFIRRLGSGKCRIVDFKDCKDANEYLVKYGPESLRQTITDAKELPIEGIATIRDNLKSFKDYLVNGFQSGYTIGIKSFDAIFSTYTKQYIIVTGKPGDGKSDFVDEMVMGYANQYGWRTAFASRENKPTEVHWGKLMSKLAGHWVSGNDYMKAEWFPTACEWIDEHFKFMDFTDNYTLEGVLDKADELVRRFGIKCLVIDPYNKTPLTDRTGKDVNQITSEYLNKLETWCIKNDALAILVAHPNKPNADEKSSYRPDLYSVKGGGEFYDMAHHGIGIYRDYSLEITEVKVLKCKFHHLGQNNASTYLKWDSRSGRYVDHVNTTNKNELGGTIDRNDNILTGTDTKIYTQNTVAGYELPPLKPNKDLEITNEIPF